MHILIGNCFVLLCRKKTSYLSIFDSLNFYSQAHTFEPKMLMCNAFIMCLIWHTICLTSIFNHDGDICMVKKNWLDSAGLWFLYPNQVYIQTYYHSTTMWLEWCLRAIFFSCVHLHKSVKKSSIKWHDAISIFVDVVIYIFNIFLKFDMEVFLFAQLIHINLTFYVKCTFSLQAKTWLYLLSKIF